MSGKPISLPRPYRMHSFHSNTRNGPLKGGLSNAHSICTIKYKSTSANRLVCGISTSGNRTMSSDVPQVPCDGCRGTNRFIHPRQEYYNQLHRFCERKSALSHIVPAAATRYEVPLCIACKRTNLCISLCVDCYNDRMDQHNMIGPLPPTRMCNECFRHSYLILPCTPHQKEDFPPGVCCCDPERLARYVESEKRRLTDMNPFMK